MRFSLLYLFDVGQKFLIASHRNLVSVCFYILYPAKSVFSAELRILILSEIIEQDALLNMLYVLKRTQKPQSFRELRKYEKTLEDTHGFYYLTLTPNIFSDAWFLLPQRPRRNAESHNHVPVFLCGTPRPLR